VVIQARGGRRWWQCSPPRNRCRSLRRKHDRGRLRQQYGLTNREVDVALLVLHGHGVEPIAAQLGLACSMVRTHLHSIFEDQNPPASRVS